MSTPDNTQHEHDATDTESATVYPFPDRTPGTELEPLVIDGVLLSNEENAAPDARRSRGELAVAGVARTKTLAVATVRTVRTVATHDKTVTGAKLLARNVLYIPAGMGVVARRVWDSRTTSRHERMMRAAEVAGDFAAVAEWEERGERFKQQRHGRAMDWLDAPVKLIRALVALCVSLFGVLVGIGIVLASTTKDLSAFLTPFTAVLNFLHWVTMVVTIVWGPLVLAAPWVAVLYVWNTGRQRATLPAWITPTSATSADVVPDEGAILNALRNLNLPPLTRKFKEGWQPRWPLATGRDGNGWRTQLELPPGVTVAMINDRKSVLAHNLVRLPVEVWPTEPKKQPGVLDLWVADPGILTGPVKPYPLLEDGTCDYFKGVPIGIDQRGDQVIGKLMASNYAAAGIMGSGKTSLVINLLLGAMLDPLVDIDVYVMAHNVDYDPMRPRLRNLVKGDDDESVLAAMNGLRELRSEVSRRGKLLEELGGEETKLTRELSERDVRMRPRVAVFDECQEMFRHDKYGDEAKELAIKVMTKARKVGITLIFVTPAPSADSLPRDLAKTVSHRVCFAIGDHQGNDAILGTGAHKQGISATSLVAGEDIGTAMASGFAARPGLLRTHHIRKEKGVDQVTPIVLRAMALREKAGITTETAPVVTAPAAPDTLADIARVLGEAQRMRTTEVLQRLATLNPGHYTGWTLEALTAFLTEWDAAPYKTGGVMQISGTRVHEAITERDEISEGVEDD